MKKVLGLDLGVASIGWALIDQGEDPGEKCSIIKTGVRVVPLSSDEKGAFEKGQPIMTNADRRLKRSMRRNLQRYHLRRESLIEILKVNKIITDESVLYENGNRTTFETYRLRAEAVEKEVSLEEFARILLMINKKRGYKSSRKARTGEDGKLLDGMTVAKHLYENNLTPGQYALQLINSGGKYIPGFYRSDLENELDRIWSFQSQFYPEILTEDFKEELSGRSRGDVSKRFNSRYNIFTAQNKGKSHKWQKYDWRAKAVSEKMNIDFVAYVISDICGDINSSSGLLGAISDRSKELFFKHETVGQYFWRNLSSDPHFSTRNISFYRQDYLDEFERIWENQARFHSELTKELKSEIRDVVIFYQRRLKSQKGLISRCEFETKNCKVLIDGKEVTKQYGPRVAPRSSMLFQEFKTWQTLNNIAITDYNTGEVRFLEQEEKERLSKELLVRKSMTQSEAVKCLLGSVKMGEINYKEIPGNETFNAILSKIFSIMDMVNDTETKLASLSGQSALDMASAFLSNNGFNTAILDFNSDLDKEAYEQQALFKLWHLLYSYEGDKSNTGDKSLVEKISTITGFPEEYARILSEISFPDDYASLSHKAIRKILPFLKEGNRYDIACQYAGYRHFAQTLTKEEIESKVFLERLKVIPKNSLRNPVVEKILNQMVNVINTITDTYGKPDEVHIELARELKSNQKQRAEASKRIDDTNKENEKIKEIIEREFGLQYVSKNDILRYKLYMELEPLGFKAPYSGKYIPREMIFSKNIDIEHIIPQAVFFDDSSSNKTLEYREINIEKGKETGYDFVLLKYGQEALDNYIANVNELYKAGKINKAKKAKMLMSKPDIPVDFLNRDLTNSQYIAKEAMSMLRSYVRTVVPTTGSITAKLREDWQLVNVMKEINMSKYDAAGMAYSVIRDGHTVKKIADWTKRDDHRHHAMDALTVAFTRHQHIQYLNNLNAREDSSSITYALEKTITQKEGSKRIFIPPMPLDELRTAFKDALESTLVSIKTNNKVVSRHINKYKRSGKQDSQMTLTPRGQLHKEQVYGKRILKEKYEVAIGPKMSQEIALTICDGAIRNAVLNRLAQNGNDPKKAFQGKNSISKTPLLLASGAAVAEKVVCERDRVVYSIRKGIDPNLSVEKVLDPKVRQILFDRITEYGGDSKKAFANLDLNPIWLNKDKGIKIKCVTIVENLPLVPLHSKRGRDAQIINATEGGIPCDFVNLRNNHHIAIYQDADGKYQEKVVSFLEALERVRNGEKAVDKNYRHDEGWRFVFSMKINEMFVLPGNNGFDPHEIDLMDPINYPEISKHLFRVQKLSKSQYYFMHHLETGISSDMKMKGIKWERISSTQEISKAVKVRINHAGEIVSIGEYD